MSRVVISSRRCLPPSDPFHNNTHLERVFIPQVAQSTSPLPGTFARCRKSFSQLATSSSLLLLLLLLAESPMISTVAAADVAPSWRAFHGAAVVDTSMVIFGGTANPNIDPFGSTVAGSNDLWVWSTTLRQWSQPTTQFTPGNSTGTNVTTTGPNPQKFLSSIPLQSQGRMMSIVSNSTTGSIQGDLLILDTIFWTWSIPTSPNPGVAPASRLGAAVGLSNNTVFLHGGAPVSAFNGYASSTPLNDLTKLDDSTFEWTSIANGPALMYHTMCKLTGINMMIIFGGSDSASNAFNNVHTFDLSLEVWALNIPVNAGSGGGSPSARKGHSAVCLNNTMVVYGGGVDTPLDDDVWVMDASVTPWVWNRITTNKEVGPGPRTGHSALLNDTNMLVWGGYGSPQANDVNIYILDTVEWEWTSSKDVSQSVPVSSPSSPGGSDSGNSSHLPLTIGVVCGSLVLIASFIAFLVLRRRASVKSQNKTELSRDNSSYLSDAEQHLSGGLSLDDKPSYYQHSGRDSGSSLGGWPSITARRSVPPPPQGYALRSMTTLSQQAANIAGLATEELVNHAESSGSADLQHSQQVQSFGRLSQGDPDQSSQRIRGGSVASDPYYPAYLAENDEEDADRWTFASSLSFDQREKKGSIPSLRYIPARTPSAAGAPRAMTQSAANLTHNYAASRAPRRDGSAPSILSGKGSSVGAGSASLSPTAAGGHALGREGSIGQRDTALFNSLSPLDRVSLMCSGIDTESQASGDDDGISATHLHPRSPQWRDSYYRRSFVSTTVDEEEERYRALNRMGSTSTTNSSTVYTTLDHPALVMLIQNLPARYLVSKSPSPIHGASNDILFAVDSDTQQPIVIKSFTRREAWERECRTLKRLRGPCIVELKHMATLVLSETDDPNKPAKIRLTILERLDETLAQMLKNARKTKKLALREQAASTSIDSTEEGAKLDLSGAELYRTGPALDACYIKDIVKGVLRCLTWCHSKKIVYCALKPTNIMRNRDDPRQQWKLIDLESSRVAEEERTSVGTTRYCPPEIALAAANSSTTGVTAQYSMDLWAFGCLLYELFATRPLIPLSAPDEMVIHFLAHPSPDTPALPNGLRWASPHELEIPHFEQAVQDKNARQLISILLHPDPQHRAVLDQVLNSEYLNGTLSA